MATAVMQSTTPLPAVNTIPSQGYTSKVKDFAKKAFSTLFSWGQFALKIFSIVVVIHVIASHPIITIAASILGFIAYKNRHTIAYVASLYACVFKNFIGITKYTWFNEINDNIILGGIPLQNKNHPKKFQEMGVTDVICLAEEFELKTTTCVTTPVSPSTWQQQGIQFKHLPAKDFLPVSMETLDQAVARMHEIVDRKRGKVYAHCKAGVGRSAMVVICYLIKHKGYSAEAALAFVKAKRPSINLNTDQRARIYEYAGKYSIRAS